MQSKLEQIRATVEETTLPGYPHLHLSLSIGAVLQGSADPLEEAVHRADSLMYQAKAKKNAIVLEAGPLTLRERDLRQQRKRQILIVDDSERNRSLLSEALQSDYRILEAPDSEKGLELLQEHLGDIALVLLDINIPVKDGFAVLQNMTRNHAIEDMSPCCKPPTISPAGTMSAGMAGATRTASRAMTSPSARRSSPWPMCTTP